MITKEIVVTGIRSEDDAGKYAVELTVDGVHKVFVFGISQISDTSVTFEDRFERTLANMGGAAKIAGLVTDFHKGIQVALPVAFQVFRLERGDKPPSFR